MGVIAIAVRHLIAAGLTGELLVAAVAEMEEGATLAHQEPQQPQRSGSAQRMARYRRRRQENGLNPNSPEYVESKGALRERDCGLCIYCGEPGTVTDHMLPIIQGGTDDIDNLGLACRPCNGAKAGKTPEQWGRPIIGEAARIAFDRYMRNRPQQSVTVAPGGAIGGNLPFFLSQDSGKKELEIQHPRETDPVDQLKALWNETAAELGLAKVQHLTEARRKHARKRLSECGGLDGMRHAMDRIRASPGLQGKAGGRAWKADFDWLLQPSSFTKLMEGGYDHWQKPKSDLMAAADRLRERVSQGNRQNAQGGGSADGLFDRTDGSIDMLDDRLSY